MFTKLFIFSVISNFKEFCSTIYLPMIFLRLVILMILDS